MLVGGGGRERSAPTNRTMPAVYYILLGLTMIHHMKFYEEIAAKDALLNFLLVSSLLQPRNSCQLVPGPNFSLSDVKCPHLPPGQPSTSSYTYDMYMHIYVPHSLNFWGDKLNLTFHGFTKIIFANKIFVVKLQAMPCICYELEILQNKISQPYAMIHEIHQISPLNILGLRYILITTFLC